MARRCLGENDLAKKPEIFVEFIVVNILSFVDFFKSEMELIFLYKF